MFNSVIIFEEMLSIFVLIFGILTFFQFLFLAKDVGRGMDV
jgi:hypothetical protein